MSEFDFDVVSDASDVGPRRKPLALPGRASAKAARPSPDPADTARRETPEPAMAVLSDA